MKRSIVVMVMLVILAIILLVGCTPPTVPVEPEAAGDAQTEEVAPAKEDTPAEELAPAEDKQYVIGFSAKTLSDPYMQNLTAAIEAQAKKYPNITLEIADAKMDLNTQLNQAEDFITKKVDVLLFTPQDADACSPIIEMANEAGVPVVCVCTDTNNKDYVSFVGSNDVDAGRMLGNFVMEGLPDGGKIAIIEGIMGQSSQINRLAGLEETILADAKYELLEIQTADWQRDKAMALVEDWLVRFDVLDAIICENDDMAMGALEAAESANRKGGIIILGVDGIADAIQAVADGRLNASILQNADAQGRKAIDVCLEVASGGTVDHQYMVPFELIIPSNVKDYM